MKVYGIKNCNSMKKAFSKLEDNNIDYEFIDYKKNVPSEDQIKDWFEKSAIDKVINKRGLSWRNVDDSEKQKIDSGDINQAISTIQNKPTLVKRPLIEHNGKVLVGLDELDKAI
jgi:Spx/MgsR family transcriptional regulator